MIMRVLEVLVYLRFERGQKNEPQVRLLTITAEQYIFQDER